MAEVSLNINGRSYPIVCDDGQEVRIEKLSAYIEERLQQIAGSGAATNDNHLLVLTSLILADELFDLRDNLELANELMSAEGGAGMDLSESAAVLETLRSVTSRISMVSETLKEN